MPEGDDDLENMNSGRSNKADANNPHPQPPLVVKSSSSNAIKEYTNEDI